MTYNPEAHAKQVREVVDSLWLPEGISAEVYLGEEPFRWPHIKLHQQIDGLVYNNGYAFSEYEAEAVLIKGSVMRAVLGLQRFIFDTRNGVRA